MDPRIKRACWLVWPLTACAVTPVEDRSLTSVEGLEQTLAPPGTCEQTVSGFDCGSDDRLYTCIFGTVFDAGRDCPRGCWDRGTVGKDACIAVDACSGGPDVCDGADNDCDFDVDEGLENECGGPCAQALAAPPGSRCNVTRGNCSSGGEYQCVGVNEVRCEPSCWYLCVRGEAPAVRTQDPCGWAMGGGDDMACVPENPDCTALEE